MFIRKSLFIFLALISGLGLDAVPKAVPAKKGSKSWYRSWKKVTAVSGGILASIAGGLYLSGLLFKKTTPKDVACRSDNLSVNNVACQSDNLSVNNVACQSDCQSDNLTDGMNESVEPPILYTCDYETNGLIELESFEYSLDNMPPIKGEISLNMSLRFFVEPKSLKLLLSEIVNQINSYGWSCRDYFDRGHPRGYNDLQFTEIEKSISERINKVFEFWKEVFSKNPILVRALEKQNVAALDVIKRYKSFRGNHTGRGSEGGFYIDEFLKSFKKDILEALELFNKCKAVGFSDSVFKVSPYSLSSIEVENVSNEQITYFISLYTEAKGFVEGHKCVNLGISLGNYIDYALGKLRHPSFAL